MDERPSCDSCGGPGKFAVHRAGAWGVKTVALCGRCLEKHNSRFVSGLRIHPTERYYASFGEAVRVFLERRGKFLKGARNVKSRVRA